VLAYMPTQFETVCKRKSTINMCQSLEANVNIGLHVKLNADTGYIDYGLDNDALFTGVGYYLCENDGSLLLCVDYLRQGGYAFDSVCSLICLSVCQRDY